MLFFHIPHSDMELFLPGLLNIFLYNSCIDMNKNQQAKHFHNKLIINELKRKKTF